MAEYIAKSKCNKECVQNHQSQKQQAVAASEKKVTTQSHDRQNVRKETKTTRKTKWYKRIGHYLKSAPSTAYCFPIPAWQLHFTSQ
jgi:hypothetical protein